MEAYRQQCWKQYYDYCNIWQKYYNKNQQAGAAGGGPSQGYGGGHGKGGHKGGMQASGVADAERSVGQIVGHLGNQHGSAVVGQMPYLTKGKGGASGMMHHNPMM